MEAKVSQEQDKLISLQVQVTSGTATGIFHVLSVCCWEGSATGAGSPTLLGAIFMHQLAKRPSCWQEKAKSVDISVV